MALETEQIIKMISVRLLQLNYQTKGTPNDENEP
jgi:hypothetical protein